MLIVGSSGGYGTTGNEWAEFTPVLATRGGRERAGSAGWKSAVSARSNFSGGVDYGVKGKTV